MSMTKGLMMKKNIILICIKYLFAFLFSIFSYNNFSIGQAEVPVLADAPGNPQVMLLLDDSGSMNAVMEHPEFDPTSSVATNTANDIPSIIFRVESGTASPTTSHTLRPVLVEINQRFSSSGTGSSITMGTTTTFANYATSPIITNVGCINTSGGLTNCPSPGASTPQTGTNAMHLFGNTSISGNSIFSTTNLARFDGVTVTDSSGHEYLYTSYRLERRNRETEDWGDVWARLDAEGNPLVLRTRAYSTRGGTVKFNNKQVFLSAGWYRIEYLRWIFYGATSQQLATLPGATRIQTVKSVVQNLVTNNPSVRWGLATLNGSNLSAGTFSGTLHTQWNQPLGSTSNNLAIIRRDIGTTTTTLLTSLNTVGAAGGTPLTNRYIEVLRYFNGETDQDSNASRTYPSPMTGPTAACDGYFVIMLTDGLPTSESAKQVAGSHITDYDGDGEESPDTSMNGCSTNTQCSQWLDDASFFAYDRDFSSSLTGKQNIRSYAVGLGVNYTLLDNFAEKGGTSQSYLASSAQEISDTLNNIVTLIITSPIAGAGAALAETFGETGIVYRPRFRADTWSGNIDVFQFNVETNQLDFSFDMAEILNSRDLTTSPRNIIAGYDTDGDGRTNQTISFSTAEVSNLRPLIFKRFIDGTESTSNLEPLIADVNANSSAENVINFIHGKNINDLRVRDRDQDGVLDRLGDIVYSRPVEVGRRNGNYNLMSGYVNFTRGLSSQPRILLVGANDGMLHAFDSLTGEELWAYIPSSQIPFLERQTRLTYNAEFRRSYVDGPISVEDVYVGGQWRTYAMFGLRRGGATYTVLDITNRTSPTLVWEVSDASIYGESWTKPVVVPVGTGYNPNSYSWRMLVGTGENRSSTGVALASYDLSSSAPPSAVTLMLNTSDTAGTRTSPINAAQTDQDLSVDRIYVGTEAGDLYRVNVTSGAASTWTVTRLFDGVSTQPIVAQPMTLISDNPQYVAGGSGAAGEPYAVGVYFGTGRYDTTGDINTVGTTAQAIFGIFDPVRPAADTFTNTLSNLTTANLQNQSTSTFATVRGADGIYRIANNRAGFYIPLSISINVSSSGFIDPVGLVQYEAANLRGALFFSTFKPDTSSCGVGGHSFLQGVNFRTGGGFIVDYRKDPRKPFYNGGIPDMDGNSVYNQTDLDNAINGKYITPAIDARVETIDLSKTKPYTHNNILQSNDIRLHSSNGGILPAVSSMGNVGAPNPPVISQSFQKVIIQSAYPSGTELGNAAGGGGGTGGDGGDGGDGGSGSVPPPDMVPISIYNLPMDILSFHESTGE
jgi:type IV pilus assembly protein PilY1